MSMGLAKKQTNKWKQTTKQQKATNRRDKERQAKKKKMHSTRSQVRGDNMWQNLRNGDRNEVYEMKKRATKH